MINALFIRNVQQKFSTYSFTKHNFKCNYLWDYLYFSRRNIHLTNNLNYKIRIDTENNHGFNAMQSIPIYQNYLAPTTKFIDNEIVNKEQFENLLARHWRSETATNIVKAFKTAQIYASANEINLSDTRFDNLVDGLMDRCQDLTDDELSELLICINRYPRTESISDFNFLDIWSALDDVCCSRIQDWTIRKVLFFTDHWYLLGLSKFSDYTIQAIKRLCRKVAHLTPSELVQTLFYINVCRKQWTMFEFECRLEKCVNDLSLDELAIISMGFFKTKTNIKQTFILARILDKLLQETSTVHEITLSAILKIIRYSPHIPIADQIQQLLTQLTPEIDRLSTVSCVHVALIGTNIQLFHPEVLKKIADKYVKNISKCRLKDLERVAFALTQFNFNPNVSPDIFDSILNELRKPERQFEIEKYPRCLACCVHYLTLHQIYPYDLINKILNPEFLKNAYGNNNKSIGREILFTNSSIDIDCPDYKGHRLDHKLQKKLTKWSVDWIPTKDQKYRLTAADKLMLDIIDTLQIIHGTKNYIHIDYILPHYQKPDIIICKDKSGKAVEVSDNFDKYSLGEIKRLPNTNDLTWYAIVIGGWNLLIRNTTDPVGMLTAKMRQLKQIGYVPVMIPWCDYMNLSRKQKEDYILNKIL